MSEHQQFDRDPKRQWLVLVVALLSFIVGGILIDVADHMQNPEHAVPEFITVPAATATPVGDA